MKTNLPISLLCGLWLSLIGLPGRAATEPAVGQDQTQKKPISVEVASGRTFTGQLDARTDPAQLWLRSGRGSTVLLRPIQWDRVVQVHAAGQDLSGEEFRQIVEAVKSDVPDQKETPPAQKKIVIKGSARSGGFLSVTRTAPRKRLCRNKSWEATLSAIAGLQVGIGVGDASHRKRTPPTEKERSCWTAAKLPERPRVRSLAIEAVVANWDADVEVDGLLVYVYPLDGTGAVVPARGTLQFDLTGQRDRVFRRRQPFATLGRWSRQIRVEDFGVDGAVYRLPFQGVHPEFDLTVAPRGALHARLSVPGQGSFETTESMVRIRPYSAVRDELQLSTGRRFFPEERTGRGRR